ncbi:MAG: lytic murein transglycosylase [Pseudomonadota bacterium]
MTFVRNSSLFLNCISFACCVSMVSCAHHPTPKDAEATNTHPQTATTQVSTVSATLTTEPSPGETTGTKITVPSAQSQLPIVVPLPMITQAEFSTCINALSENAKAAGISNTTITSTLAKANFNSRVIELDRRQPEFSTTFADYFNGRVTDQRVAQAQALMEKHQILLDKVVQQYGVPAHYLLAFWGLETNYGSFFGKFSTVDSLATLACDARRSSFFTGELISALRILDEGTVTSDKMVGSWSGAMGNFQFMPSAFLQHAVDYDGDNKRDLWNSTADATASAAKFLQSLGWQTKNPWGYEVKLPVDFPFVEAGLKNIKLLSEWRKLGVTRADNMLLPTTDLNASLLVPSGYNGPAFLVFDNFNVIMQWNRSEFYALAVGNLADRIAGAGKLVQPPPLDAPRLHRDQVIKLQEQLNQLGFNVGMPDGIFGPGTRRAISEFQHKIGMVADGFPDKKMLGLLGVNLDAVKN